jgi:hypothetical protein
LAWCAVADGEQFGRGIQMAERAPDRSTVSRLPVTDLQDRLPQEGANLSHPRIEFHVALPRHRADHQTIGRDFNTS